MAPVKPNYNNVGVNQINAKYGMNKLNYNKFYFDHNGLPVLRTGQDDPHTTTDLTYVQLGDTGTPEYVAGSQGRVKTIKEYITDYNNSTKAKLSTFWYEDVSFPLNPTKIIVDVVDVV